MWRNPGHSETLVSPLQIQIQIQIQIQGDFANNACILKGRWDAWQLSHTHARQTAEVCARQQWPSAAFVKLSVCT